MKGLKFYSPLRLFGDDDYGIDPLEFQQDIETALEKDDIDLARYADDYHGDSYYKKLHSCKLETDVVNGRLYGVAVCEVEDDWNDTDTAQMKEYLEGQYSDGYGEGFEQHEIAECEGELTERYEDEDGEEQEETFLYTYGIYCSFWECNDNWFIKTEEELKQDMKKDKECDLCR